MVNYIVFHEQAAETYKIEAENRMIGEFGHLNVFVGVNNSGKSKFLRFLFENSTRNSGSNRERKITFFNSNFYSKNLSEIYNELYEYYREEKNKFNYISYGNEANKKDQELKIFFLKQFHDEILQNGDNLLNFIYYLDDFETEHSITNRLKFDSGFKNDFLKKLQNSKLSYVNYLTRLHVGLPINSIYIPILRGLRPLYTNDSKVFQNIDLYTERTSFDYFKPNLKSNIFSGLSIFDEIKKLLLGDEVQRELISDFENFLEKQIFDQKVTLIPKYNGDVLHIKIGNDPQLEVYNLGDGLQTIITILFPIYIKKDEENLIFIEEPETHLHPYWQNKLITALLNIPNQQYFVTSHSSAFINHKSSKNFSIEKNNDVFSIKPILFENEKFKLLSDLGYKNSDLLNANYIIWVEGPSDKIYLQYWIKQINKNLENGRDFIILPFGGNNFKSLFFNANGNADLKTIESINRNYSLLIDSDRINKSKRIQNDKIKLSIEFKKREKLICITDYREIENHIPINEFENAVKNLYDFKFELQTDEYADRMTAFKITKEKSIKQHIKIPDDLFIQIKKNHGEIPEKLDSKLLISTLNKAIKETEKELFSINKNNLANEYCKTPGQLPSGNLHSYLVDLVNEIVTANKSTL